MPWNCSLHRPIRVSWLCIYLLDGCGGKNLTRRLGQFSEASLATLQELFERHFLAKRVSTIGAAGSDQRAPQEPPNE